MALGSQLVVLNDAELAAFDREERLDRPWENYKQRILKAEASSH
jgi:hypothetical protein